MEIAFNPKPPHPRIASHSLCFKFPILYTFRRCPFAMRARFILRSKSKFVELREIKLQTKPAELINISMLTISYYPNKNKDGNKKKYSSWKE